jgi:hypothetical protein
MWIETEIQLIIFYSYINFKRVVYYSIVLEGASWHSHFPSIHLGARRGYGQWRTSKQSSVVLQGWSCLTINDFVAMQISAKEGKKKHKT